MNPTAHVVDCTRSPNAKLRPLPLGAVQLRDTFWEPRCVTNRSVTLLSQHRRLEEAKNLDNFRIAAGQTSGKFTGPVFTDSDIYKWLEAASWSLATHPDERLEELVDGMIALVALAQQEDGYLNTYFMFDRVKERWTNLKDQHELYCAGHLFQAAVAHHRATGKDSLLRIARRFADHICSVFGPSESGRREGCPGHEEVEMGLIELARDTGERKYLSQAKYFLDARGRGLIGGRDYHQDHKPVRELDRVTGHAVRMVYLACGMTDFALELDDPPMRAALGRIWSNMTGTQMYLTGGLGSRHEGEAFGRDFELPNERAYTETCAAIGSIMWNWRMLLLTGEARFADLIERTLYNGLLSGVSFDGEQYFYVNPLADDGMHRRQKWFGCACCPPNVARLLSSLPAYFYSISADPDRPEVFVHLYASSAATFESRPGKRLTIEQESDYPWNGSITIKVVAGDGDFALKLRIPEFGDGATIHLNGQPLREPLSPGSYATIRRAWRSGDVVTLNLPMLAQIVECHPHASDNLGRVAVMRGPIVYCVEQADNPSIDPRDIALKTDAQLSAEHVPERLHGVTVVRAQATAQAPDASWNQLYRPLGASTEAAPREVPVTLIPYYAWASREPGRMQVWLRRG